jgi:hypothetical protein
MDCVLQTNLDIYVYSKYCIYPLKIYKTLSLVDAIRKRAWRCKCKFKKILPLKEEEKIEAEERKNKI